MQSELIREISEVIVREQLLLNWKFYLLTCAVSLIAVFLGSFLISYFQKRGETLATKSDKEQILHQLHETTRVTEEVKSSVSHADWIAREWRMTRRLKLEELLSSIYAIEIWLELQRSKWMEQKTVSIDDAPMEKLQMLTSLYFPELKDEILLILACYRNIYMLILDIGELFIRSKIENNKIAQAAVDEFLNKYKPLYENARIVIAAIETKASKLMLEIATI